MKYGTIHAFDLSLAAPGWAKRPFNATFAPCITSGCWRAEITTYATAQKGKPEDPLATLKKIDWIRREVSEQAMGSTVNGDPLVVMEDFSFASPMQAHQLGGLQYCVRMTLWKRNIPFVLVAPTRLKKFVTGKGVAEKSMMLQQVYKRFGIECKDDNEADAVGLLHIGLAMVGAYECQTEPQRQVVADMHKAYPWVKED